MKKLAIALTTSLFIMVLALSYMSSDSASAQCAQENSASLLTQGSVQTIGNIAFYNLEAAWSCKGTPFIGWVSQATGTIGVKNVQYFPQYFFPNDCEGQVNIVVACEKTGNGPHLLNTQLDVGPQPNGARSLEPVTIP